MHFLFFRLHLHLYQNVFAKFKLALPAVTEQQIIVDFLDKKVGKIDDILYGNTESLTKGEMVFLSLRRV